MDLLCTAVDGEWWLSMPRIGSLGVLDVGCGSRIWVKLGRVRLHRSAVGNFANGR